jgi:NAD-dependent SIR2 family protein deacetylase
MEIRTSKDNSDRTARATGSDKDFICTKCGNQLEYGYICENNDKLILCKPCQDSYKMIKCKHDENGEHRHIKFVRE